MFEADVHLRPLHTSIFDIYKVFEPLVCCLKSIRLHPYTVTLAILGPNFGIQVHLKSRNDAITVMVEVDVHLKSIHTSLFDKQKVLEPLVCCLNGIWLHPYYDTGQVGPRFGDSDSLEEW